MIFCPYCGNEGDEIPRHTRPFCRTMRRIYRCATCRKVWKTIEVLVTQDAKQSAGIKRSSKIWGQISSNPEDFLAFVCVALNGRRGTTARISGEMQEKLKKYLERT